MNTPEYTAFQLADKLYETQNQMRALEIEEANLKNELVGAMAVAGMDQIVGSYAQAYVRGLEGKTKYTFDIPESEYERLGIKSICTPQVEPPKPKLTKTEMDKLVKQGRISNADVVTWEANGWYAVDRPSEVTVKQAVTKMEDLQSVAGF